MAWGKPTKLMLCAQPVSNCTVDFRNQGCCRLFLLSNNTVPSKIGNSGLHNPVICMAHYLKVYTVNVSLYTHQIITRPPEIVIL